MSKTETCQIPENDYRALEANSDVSGMFKARQEIPVEKQQLAIIIILVGLIGTTTSIIAIRMKLFCSSQKNCKYLFN